MKLRNQVLILAVIMTFGIPVSAQVDACVGASGSPASLLALTSAKGLRLSGQLDAASKTVEEVLRREPKSFRGLYNRGLVFIDMSRYEDAERALTEAARVQQHCASQPGFVVDYSIYNSLGWVQMVRGETSAAEKNFKIALGYADKMGAATLAKTKANLGSLYFSNGDFERAGAVLEQAIDLGNKPAQNTLSSVKQAETAYEKRKMNMIKRVE